MYLIQSWVFQSSRTFLCSLQNKSGAERVWRWEWSATERRDDLASERRLDSARRGHSRIARRQLPTAAARRVSQRCFEFQPTTSLQYWYAFELTCSVGCDTLQYWGIPLLAFPYQSSFKSRWSCRKIRSYTVQLFSEFCRQIVQLILQAWIGCRYLASSWRTVSRANRRPPYPKNPTFLLWDRPRKSTMPWVSNFGFLSNSGSTVLLRHCVTGVSSLLCLAWVFSI